jgi:hypothetical protein
MTERELIEALVQAVLLREWERSKELVLRMMAPAKERR